MASEGSQRRILCHPAANRAFLRTCSVLMCSIETLHESSKIHAKHSLHVACTDSFDFRTEAVCTCKANSVITIQVKQILALEKLV